MNVLVITHNKGQKTEVFREWAENHNYNFKTAAPFEGEKLDLDFDILIIMGGTQRSVYIEQYPYLQDEVDLIKMALQENKKVLGFCLGAQLIGIAMGVDAELSPHKEVGVFDIHMKEGAQSDPLLSHHNKDFKCILWHNDMMGVLDDSAVLAESEGCPRQIVRYRKGVYGFQCHPEFDLDTVREVANLAPEDLGETKFRKSKECFLEYDFKKSHKFTRDILDQLVRL